MKIYFCEKCGISIPLQEVVGGTATARDGKTYCDGCRPGGAPTEGGDLKLYFCDNCRVSIPIQDVITNQAKAEGEQMICADCARLTKPQRRVRSDQIKKEMEEREESRYRLHFCDVCNTSIPQSHLVTARAVVRAGRTYCERCRSRAERRRAGSGTMLLTLLMIALLAVGAWVVFDGKRLLAGTGEKEVDKYAAFEKRLLEQVEMRMADREKRLREDEQDVEKILRDYGMLEEDQKKIRSSQEDMLEMLTEAANSQSMTRNEFQAATAKAEVAIRELDAKFAAFSSRIAELERRPVARTAEPEPEPVKPEPVAPKPPPVKDLPAKVKRFIAELKDDDPGIRFSAAVELGRQGHKGAAGPLVDVLKNDKDTFVRRAAARSIGELNAWLAVPSLIETLGDKEYFVAITAHKAIGAITGQDFGFRENLSRSEMKKVVKKAKQWWEAHASDRSN